MQNELLGQETDARLLPGSIVAGDYHDVPLYVSALPVWSTATQNEALGQVTEVMRPEPPSMLGGEDHDVPS